MIVWHSETTMCPNSQVNDNLDSAIFVNSYMLMFLNTSNFEIQFNLSIPNSCDVYSRI